MVGKNRVFDSDSEELIGRQRPLSRECRALLREYRALLREFRVSFFEGQKTDVLFST